MLCEELMTHDYQYVSPRDTVEDAAVKMRDANIGFLPVCDQSRKVLGALTDRDLAVRVVAARKPGTTLVEEAMTTQVVACTPKDDVDKAVQLMAREQKSRIMCVNNRGELLGVISLSDIARHGEKTHAAEALRRITERETAG